MTPDELDRELARLAALAREARQRLDGLVEQVHAVQVSIDEAGASTGGHDASAAEAERDGTTAAGTAQVELVSK